MLHPIEGKLHDLVTVDSETGLRRKESGLIKRPPHFSRNRGDGDILQEGVLQQVGATKR